MLKKSNKTNLLYSTQVLIFLSINILISGCGRNILTPDHSPIESSIPRSLSKSTAYNSRVMTYAPAPVPQHNRENYLPVEINGIHLVAEKPVSTFSIDVDTAGYSNIRRMLMQGNLPSKDAVKNEELINYFSYTYPSPKTTDTPFSVTTEIAPSPWNINKKLLHIGIKGYEVEQQDLPPSNLVFLVDVSGSMNHPNKLELIKKSLKLLLKQLGERDKMSLVTYASNTTTVLEPTSADQKLIIEQAIEQLNASGATNGEGGINAAYALAQKAFIKGGINRVLIASDGDMNVGKSDITSLKALIEKKRKLGISLTTLGYGIGNYNYALMEQLADIGDGNAAYIDNLLEAQKVLVKERNATLLTIAKDVKIQIEFSPQVKEYRLIGYENRLLKREDFNNDKVDAGDIGAGHTVTALYEITLAGGEHSIDPLRYQQKNAHKENPISNIHKNELAFVKIRYKAPNKNKSNLVSHIVKHHDLQDTIKKTSDNFKFSASVAAFGQLLQGGKHLKDFHYLDIIKLAKQSRGKDNNGYRAEFINLVELAKNLSPKITPEKE